MIRWLIAWAVLAGATVTRAGDATPDRFARVVVEPARTSIYLGSVSLTMPPFVRSGDSYAAPYTAKVFPFIFYNETGNLQVDVPADLLAKLAQGEPIEFHGRAVRDGGAERRVEGKATPADATTGKLKVRVFYSKRIELIFNTTYRFEAATAPSVAPASDVAPGSSR
jgi:hypothetical protein